MNGNASVTGTATVTGKLTAGSVETSGNAKAASSTVTGNATVGGTLGVTGDTTLNGTLTVTGKLTMGGFESSGIAKCTGLLATGYAAAPEFWLANASGQLTDHSMVLDSANGNLQHQVGSASTSPKYTIYDSKNCSTAALPSTHFTADTTYVSGHSAKMRKLDAMGMVYFHLYVKLGDHALSANTAYNVGTIDAAYCPTQQEALSAYGLDGINATITTEGKIRIVLDRARAAGTNFACYITGFWFV